LKESFKHGKAASYLADKALSQTKVSWIHLYLRGRKFEMRNYLNAVAALALALVLTTPASAGIMYPEKTPPPPPPSATSVTQSDVTDGTTSTDVTVQGNTTGDATTASSSVTETALNLLQSVLALF
jgi:hypothetical protein